MPEPQPPDSLQPVSEQKPQPKTVRVKQPGLQPEQRGVVLPDYKAPRVRDVDFELLRREHGVKVALIDVDNTLTPVGVNRLDDPEVGALLRTLQEQGVLEAVYLATRSARDLRPIEQAIHAQKFTPPHGVAKPDPAYFDAFIKQTGYKPNEVVMIGDRVTHDIAGAEKAGLVTVLVDPIGKGTLVGSLLHGWIPKDYIDGTRRNELKALEAVRKELRKITEQTQKS